MVSTEAEIRTHPENAANALSASTTVRQSWASTSAPVVKAGSCVSSSSGKSEGAAAYSPLRVRRGGASSMIWRGGGRCHENLCCRGDSGPGNVASHAPKRIELRSCASAKSRASNPDERGVHPLYGRRTTFTCGPKHLLANGGEGATSRIAVCALLLSRQAFGEVDASHALWERAGFRSCGVEVRHDALSLAQSARLHPRRVRMPYAHTYTRRAPVFQVSEIESQPGANRQGWRRQAWARCRRIR